MGFSASTMSTVGMASSVAGTLLSASGASSQAASQRNSYDYQASVAASNARVAQLQASDAIRNGQTAEETQRLKTGALMGTQRATLAANGVDLGEGNANDILATTKYMGDRDAAQIHYNAALTAWGYKSQQGNYLANAEQLKSMSDSVSPLMAAGTSLLTGATGVASNWYRLQKVGADNPTIFGTTDAAKSMSSWGF